MEWRAEGEAEEGTLPLEIATADEWNFVVGRDADLFRRLTLSFDKLDDIAHIFVGIQTSADDVFIMDKVEETPNEILLRSQALGEVCSFEKDLLFPIVSGVDVQRYGVLPARQYVLFPYVVDKDLVKIVELSEIHKTQPKTASYLDSNKERLEGREKGKLKGGNWHGYIYLKNMRRQPVAKVCVPRLVENLSAAYDSQGTRFLDNVDVGGVVPREEYAKHSLEYFLGLLNAKLLDWHFQRVSAPFRGGFRSANRQFLGQLPIRTIDFSDAEDVERHERMVGLVERMLGLHERLAEARIERERTVIGHQISATDKQIDRLVYELYGLNEEEIAIVEEATGR
jgi:hypothetical protein